MQVVDIFLNRNPTLSNSGSQESLHSALEQNEAILEHKMLDSDSAVGRGQHFGGGIARARFNSHENAGLTQQSASQPCFGHFLGGGNGAGGGGSGLDFSVLPKILQSITLFQWRSSKVGKRTFSRSKIVDSIGLEDSLADGLRWITMTITCAGVLCSRICQT